MLGDLLAGARNITGAFPGWLETSDPALMAQVAQASARAGETPTQYVRGAVHDYTCFASDEEWTMLTSRLRDSPDPGEACLLAMVHWRLAATDARRPTAHDEGSRHEHHP
ncbi:MAG TPA: hypothetical protein VK827_04500 [Lysobacter sp.]|nr:hypothetical protein [Lysobacter sp.]